MKIKRARGHRLYTVEGKKILDLSMDWGRAVLGHRPNGLSLTLKNAIDRGIYTGYDNIYYNRLKKDLLKRFPEYKYLTISDSEIKIEQHFNSKIFDPLFDKCDKNMVSYWRPFLDIQESDNLVILYPLPGLNSTTVLISKEPVNIKSDRVSPILLAGILRSLNDYDAALKTFKSKAYECYRVISHSLFKPPYLVLDRDGKEYEKLCLLAEENDLMLNNEKPVIIMSGDYSKGETAKVLDLLG